MSNPENVSIQSFLQRIGASSAAFAKRATFISNWIEIIAESLCELPGKTKIEHTVGDITVSFEKREHWGLWLADGEAIDQHGDSYPEDLTTVSIARKARAFPLLVELLPLLEEDQQRQVAELDKAIGSLQPPPNAAGSGAAKPGPGVEGARAGAVRVSGKRVRDGKLTFEIGPEDFEADNVKEGK